LEVLVELLLERHDIRVNAVSPGECPPPLLEYIMSREFWKMLMMNLSMYLCWRRFLRNRFTVYGGREIIHISQDLWGTR
jgi:NAD(P)-dependent dehydrogenase (short-subunit alcohol dehydrogenase family)